MKTLLWLDDIRNPLEDSWLVFSPIEQPFNVVWVKSYIGFVKYITDNGLPTAICFDHDLGDDHKKADNGMIICHHGLAIGKDGYPICSGEKTGMDCAKWLVEYCMDNDKTLPLYNIQSANPVGKENIDSLLKNYLKHSKK